MLCSICIATYKRPLLLEKLLNSLLLQNLPDEIELEIIVVDNDSEKSAKPSFEKFRSIEKIKFYYYSQPLKNISVTRNLAVDKAQGEYLLFIDDDEIASPNWIKFLVKTIKQYNVDGVFGRVISHFSENTQEWIKKSYIFNRPSPPTGTTAIFTRTGNCIIKSALLKNIPGPFDPSYGITGGEDTHLFGKLKRNGAKFINCYEAWVSEFQPPSRTQAIYLIKRAFFTGNLFTRRKLEASNNRISVRLYLAFKAFIYIIISMLLAFLMLPNKHWRTHWVTKIASNLGHILATINISIKAY